MLLRTLFKTNFAKKKWRDLIDAVGPSIGRQFQGSIIENYSPADAVESNRNKVSIVDPTLVVDLLLRIKTR